MTETIYWNRTYKADHTRYGGEITLFDFEGHQTMKTMSNRIVSTFAFDKRCERNIKLRNNTKK